MTNFRGGLLLSLFFFCVTWGWAAVPGGPDDYRFTTDEQSQGYRNGRVLVKLKDGVAEEASPERMSVESRSGVSNRHVFHHLNRQQMLEFDGAKSVPAVIKELRATGLYEFVEADHIVHALVTPNDPSFGQQWSLNNTGQSGGVAGADIGAAAAWSVQSTAPNVIVAIIDSGIRVTHTDLAANVWNNPNPSSSFAGTDLHGINATVTPATGNPNDDETDGHGSHVSGIIGAVGNNAIGISGVAWKVQLMALKFLDSTGSGSTSGELICLDYAIAHNAAIINGSFGSNAFSSSEFAALQRVHDAGIIFVAAAGNDGLNVESDAAYPAGYLLDNVVSVAATTRTDTLASYSNFSSGTVDLAAPGSAIISTINSSDTAYATYDGTSMAAPHVAGTLALMKAHFPNDTYRQLINRLLRSTTKLSALSGKVQSGGRLNLASALNSTDNRPFNDDFAARAQLAGANVRVRSSNAGATRESGEPTHAGVGGGASLWWTWTAPVSSTVAFDTANSTYDTALAVYTGGSLNTLQLVGSNDDASAGVTTSRVTLNASAGTTYQIAVDGKNGASGATVLRIGTVPTNDNFSSAQVVSGTSFSVTGSTLNAKTEPGEPNHAGVSGGHSVWYKWTAPSTGRFQLAAVSSSIDMIAAVYTGSSVSSLTLIASNNNSVSFNIDSLVSFNATTGQTYFFAVDNTDVDGGDFTLSLNDSVWQFPTGDSVTSSPAVGTDGTVYFGSNDGFVYAVNRDGSQKWERATGDSIDTASPAIGPDGTVYIGSNDGFLYALNNGTGTRKWRFAAASGISSAPAIATDGTIYFRDDTTLYALTNGATSATKKWGFALSGSTYCSPAIATDGTVYVGATGGAFYAVNPSGTQKWKFTADGDIYTSPAIANDGTIYFATLSGSVYALRPDGTQKWVWSVPGGSSVTSSPALGADGTLYFGAYDHKLHALGSDGVEKWSFTAGDEMRASSPAIASDGTVYFGDYDSLLYAVSSTGALQRVYTTAQPIRSSPIIVNGRLYFGSNDSKLYAFALNQNGLSSAWPTFHQNALRTGQAVAGPFVTLTAQPQSQLVIVGNNVVLSVAATGTAPVTYQWLFNGTAIANATGSTYTLPSAQSSDSGDYSVMVTDPTGSVASAVATLTVKPVGFVSDSRLYALSCRAVVGTGGDILIPGIIIGGSGSRQVVVRASGPALATQGVSGTLAQPQLQLYQVGVSSPIASNVGWSSGNTSALQVAFTQANLPSFPLGSADCALLATLTAGQAYTAQVSGLGSNPTGVALVEVYELGTTNARMTALSCRARVGVGGDILIPGIIIIGSSPKKVIIRASGPALAAQGVPGTLAQLQLRLFDGSGTKIAENIGWSTVAANVTEISAATAACGLPPFVSGSADCAIVTTLPSGGYTAQVSGLNGTTGVALIEVYEVP